jgi:hypothetical protein
VGDDGVVSCHFSYAFSSQWKCAVRKNGDRRGGIEL